MEFPDQFDRIRVGLGLLLEAYGYAHDAQRDVWDFAVEISILRGSGLSQSDLRWLGCKGYVEYAAEITLPGETTRSFRPQGALSFCDTTCSVLTDAGLAYARQQFRQAVHGPSSPSDNGRFAHSATERSSPPLPRWDADRLELTFVGEIVKRFKAPAPNQEAVLAVFEEEGWPPRIDDPLSPHPEQDPKRRLLDTIKCLNRNQKMRSIHVLGDGTGQGVRWEPVLIEDPQRS